MDTQNLLRYSKNMRDVQLFPVSEYGMERLQRIILPEEQLRYTRFSASTIPYEAAGNQWCFAIDQDGDCVGYLNAEEDFEGDLYIRKLVVAYSHQQMGIGTDAMEQFIQMARSAGARFVMLSVAYQNEGAERFYRKLGFLGTELGLAEAGCKLLTLSL